MTPIMLVDALVHECETLFAGAQAKGEGGLYRPLRIHPQDLPARTQRNQPDYFPFLLVHFDKAEQQTETEPIMGKVLFLAGIYDDNSLPDGGEECEDFQGFRDPYSILWRLSTHLFGVGIVGGNFQPVFPWTLEPSENNAYPYFYAGMMCGFLLPGLYDTEAQKHGYI